MDDEDKDLGTRLGDEAERIQQTAWDNIERLQKGEITPAQANADVRAANKVISDLKSEIEGGQGPTREPPA